jgi:hypothetical protein
MKKLMLVFASIALFALSAAAVEMPKSVVHVINVKFKADAPKADVDAAIAGIGEMAKKFPDAGITRVWLSPIVVQGGASGFTHCLVMEFKDAAALKAYSGSAAQKWWYEKWIKVRELSNTHDVTNK